MDKIEIKEYDIEHIFSDRNMLSSGSEGKVYLFGNDIIKINKDVCTKLVYKVPIEYNSKYFELINELILRQPLVMKTSLPKKIVMYKGCPIASISKYHKDYYCLYDEMFRLDPDVVLRIIKKALINYKELTAAGIYNSDFVNKNVLFNNDDVQLIDIDSLATFIDINSDEVEKNTKELFHDFINDYLRHMFVLDRHVRKDFSAITKSDDYITFIEELQKKKCIVSCFKK